MRILFVGDYDSAGRYTATRLYREGHRVCWLTEEPQKELWDQRVSGKVYRRPVNYRTCRQILQGESINCIFLLTSYWREPHLKEERESASLLALFHPVLQAAASMKMACVAMISSLDLQQQELLSPLLEELRGGEKVLQAFCREHKIPCLLLRIGCVFGEDLSEETGFAGEVLSALGKGQSVTCPFAEDASFDFLCGSDFADAVNRLINLNAEGVFHVATGHPVTAGFLYQAAAAATGYTGTVEYGERSHSSDSQCGGEVRQLCGWMPFYLFEETAPVYLKSALLQQQNGPQKKQWKILWQRVRQSRSLFAETLQNLLLFAVTVFVSSYAAGWEDLRYVDVRLLYVVIVAISFGMRQGLLATVLAILSYLVSLLQSQIDISYVLYSVDSWIPFIIYGIAGAFAGYWSDKKNDDYDGLMNEYQEQGDRYQFLKELYRDVVEVKNNLQKQIVVSRDSLGHLYSITEELNSLSPRTICFRTVGVMEEIMECQSAALYLKPQKESSFGRLMACSASLSQKLSPSIDFRSFPKLWDAMAQWKLYVNTELDPKYPALAMAVWDGDDLVAIAALYEIAPNQYTVYYRNLFQTLVRMIQDNLTRAFRYQEQNRDRIFISGTSVLTPEAFEKECEALKTAREERNYPVSAAIVVAPENLQGKALYGKVGSLLRGTDLLGVDRSGRLHAVFLYVTRNSRGILEQRFQNNGFSLEWEE